MRSSPVCFLTLRHKGTRPKAGTPVGSWYTKTRDAQQPGLLFDAETQGNQAEGRESCRGLQNKTRDAQQLGLLFDAETQGNQAEGELPDADKAIYGRTIG